MGGKEDLNCASNLGPNHSREEQRRCLPTVLLVSEETVRRQGDASWHVCNDGRRGSVYYLLSVESSLHSMSRDVGHNLLLAPRFLNVHT